MKNNFKFLGKFRFRSIIINILVSLSIFLVFTVVIEIVLRATHLFGAHLSWTENDSILGYRFIPNSKYWVYNENDHPITGRFNSYGWRDKEWSLEKPENVYRIAVLGDSMVEAMQVESDRTFLALTEQQLSGNHKLSVELLNFGRSGYTQTEELLVLKNEVELFSPEMVIVFFLPLNDIKDVSKETALELLRPFYIVSEKEELIIDTSFVNLRKYKNRTGFKKHSALLSLINDRYNSYRQQLTINKRTKCIETMEISKWGMDKYLSLCTSNPDTTYLKNYQLNKMLIKAMAKYCKEKGIRFMLVTIDTDAYIPKIEEKYKYIDPTFDANFFEDDLKNYATSLSIEYLGLQRIFRQAYENTSVSLHWGHWNYEGHKVVASALSGKLKSIIAQVKDW